MALRNLLRTPAHLRPLLIQQPHHTHPSPISKASYHSYEPTEQQPLPYRPAESAILSAALTTHVPRHGFTPEALRLGAKDAGYLDISANLFPAGAFELVKFHLVTQRLALKDRVQFPSPPPTNTTTPGGPAGSTSSPGMGTKVRTLILSRLRANLETGTIPHWQQALGLMSLAENIPASLRELGRLSDEIWFLAGDQAVDSSWYTKRASLMGVWAATEGFQSQVMKGAAGWSPQEEQEALREVEEFLDRRLEEVRVVGGAVGSTMQWAGFQARGFVNLVRSKGVRI
ncbi:hypothetical protein KC343_g6045 [Hortaea werneckii]|uniref:Ubiquinone biosynthesis protein n=1 Tax=Hortaea werneckii TaxID=91943 RepID=A0A3M7HZY8_HORWE|nr:hypothetical protein KC338_g4618 [Hortaea werneckii]KAI6874810.1 hypothetical protein KC323_g582 [Hortaea werneckii]KAI7165868.1 hypothetical protein KC352_g26041 [Hortaea werneckii]KAI7356031.1 hypothetical protein KC320_g2468 [Hortaea werneckii]KAI7550523.1 hypothetical protein KC317_g14246 [Hortaea werneckii]